MLATILVIGETVEATVIFELSISDPYGEPHAVKTKLIHNKLK
jgi:hypothetical protein